jgi:capsular polysaccharide transport system permease protein
MRRTTSFIKAKFSSGSMKKMQKFLTDRLFIALVITPTLLAILYFGMLASDVYISESRFVVRSPDKPALTGLGVLFKNAAFSNASDEASAANDFIQSRDALHAIDHNNAFRQAYTASSISIFDRFDPTGRASGFEDLFKYFKRRVKVDADNTTGITVLTVRGYDPRAAQRFNARLLEMAEATVNRLNNRARNDLIHFANLEVQEAENNVRTTATELAAFRNSHGVVDPERQATMQLQMISKLQDELIASRSQLAQLRKSAPDNPAIPVLETQITSLSDQIAGEMDKVAGGTRSLAGEATSYQNLMLRNELATRQLTAAMASLDQAQTEARRKQTYVERISEPSLPDEAEEPYRLRGIIATFLLGLTFWGIAKMLIASIREHVD